MTAYPNNLLNIYDNIIQVFYKNEEKFYVLYSVQDNTELIDIWQIENGEWIVKFTQAI